MTRTARLLTYALPLALLAVQPAFWFPGWYTYPVVAGLVALWLARALVGLPLLVRTVYDLPVLLLVLWLPVTLVPVADWSLAIVKAMGVFTGCAMIYALAAAVQTRRAVLAAAAGTVLLGVAVALAGLVLTDWLATKAPGALASLYARLPLLLSLVRAGTARGGIHPNQLAGVLVLLVPLALTLCWLGWRERRERRGRLLLLAGSGGALVMILVCLLTLSRSGISGLAFGVLVLGFGAVLTGLVPGRLKRPALAALTVAALADLAAIAVQVAVWAGSAGRDIDSFSSRIGLWGRALTMIGDFPLSGVGLGQFPLVLERLYAPALFTPEEFLAHAHNFGLQLALDLGIPGALAVIAMIVIFGWQQVRVARTASPDLRLVALGLVSGMTAFLTYGLIDAISIGARGFIIFWIVLGLGAAVAQVAKTQEPA